MWKFILAICALILTTQSLWAQSCVVNASDHAYFFAVTPRDGARVTAPLQPGEHLCVDTENGATLSVYENTTALEGCSRLVTENQSDSLIKYADFDRCAWESHTR